MTVIEGDRTRPDRGAELGAIDAADPATDQALFEEARRLRRRKRRRTAVLVTTVAVLALTLAFSLRALTAPTVSTDGGTRPSPAPPGTAGPTELVVWRDFDLQLVTTSGHTVRTLATGIALFRGVPALSVSNGGTVYFDQGVEPVPGRPTEQVWSVPLSGGPPTVVATDGYDPAVSPDGRELAYQLDTELSNGPATVVVRNLRTGATTTYEASSSGTAIDSLTWSPSSTTLAVTTTVPAPDGRSASGATWLVDVSAPSGPIENFRQVPVPSCPPGLWAFPGVPTVAAWAGFVGETDGLAVCPHAGLSPASSTLGFAVIDVATGRTVGALLALPGRLATDSAFVFAGGAVQIDATGRHLALVTPGSGDGLLEQWPIGKGARGKVGRPSIIARGVASAAWVPVGA